jgi:deoxyribonuclease-4
MILGAHCSTAGGLHKALERAVAIGGASCQIFVKNNMQWTGAPLPPAAADRFAAARKASSLACVFGHTGYLINLGGPPGPKRDQSLQSLINELQLAAALKLPFLVLHPGAHLGQGEEAGLRQIAAGLDEAARATRGSKVRIALENTAGQGTCLGHQLEHIAGIFDRVAHPKRLGVCLDTAHLFEAGLDLRTPQVWDEVMQKADQLFGLGQILAFHLNDSKSGLGSRVDRHAGIGQGHIGREAFRHILNDARFASHPGCLETPKSPGLHEDIENLAILRSLQKPA